MRAAINRREPSRAGTHESLQTRMLTRFRSARLDTELLVLAAPAAILVIVFFLVPLANVFVLSVTDPKPGFSNYELLFSSAGMQRIIARTLRLSVVTTVVSVVVGYLLAYVLAASSRRQRNAMLFFILVPFWASALVRAFSWILLLGREGPVNTLLQGAGLISEPINVLYSETGVTIAMVHYMLPYAVFPLYSAMKNIDAQLLWASRGLGASPGSTFLHVFLPVTRPAIVAAASLVFVYSLGFYVIPIIVGGGRVIMIGQYISINVLDTAQWGVASMLSVTLLVSILLMRALERNSTRLMGQGKPA
jgi:putative spermidine/putrescine transport system permease protein